jgi:hypothetical protein
VAAIDINVVLKSEIAIAPCKQRKDQAMIRLQID